MKNLILGLTGSIGSGKSTVSKILESKYGFYIIDADKIAHDITNPGSPVLPELAAEFGGDILKDGVLDRRLLASRAFVSDVSTEKLNSITHPHILRKIMSEIDVSLSNQKKRIVIDAPLLFEAGLEKLCGAVLSVTVPYDIQLRRVMNRDGCSDSDVIKRLERQHPPEFYIERSDYIIDNSGSEDVLKNKIAALISELRGGGFDV